MMEQPTQDLAPLSISSLPLELLAAIFGQFVASTAEDENDMADDAEITGNGQMNELGDDSASTEDEGEGEEREKRGREKKRAKCAPRGHTNGSRDKIMDSLRGALTASAVCSAWREIVVKENALWRCLTLARWRVWEDTSWRTRRNTNWRAVHFQRVRRDKEVLSLLTLLARTSTHNAAMQRLRELGMDVWEKLTTLTARWKRQPLQHLGHLHNAAACMQALTEQRMKKEWERILPSIALSRDDLSGSDSDDQRAEDMDFSSTSGTGSSNGSSPEEDERVVDKKERKDDDGDEENDEENEDDDEEGRRRVYKGMAKREDVDIEEGAILIASWEHANDLNLRRRVYRELDDIARIVRQRLARNLRIGSSSGRREGGGGEVSDMDEAEEEEDKEPEGVDGETILNEVNTTLYDYLGFSGNVNDYMNPDNSFIDRVLAKKMGIPITLAVVYAAVCRRLHIRIDMVGMPGHFMVKYRSPSGQEIFIDAFSEGRRLTEADCRAMLESMGMTFFSPDLLRPVGHLAVYERMLANLLGVYQRLRQTDKLLGVAKQLLILRGETSAEDLLTCGRLHMLLDQFTEARPLLQRVLHTSTNPEYLEQARALMVALETSAQDVTPPKRRTGGAHPQLRFRVGQVIRHVRHAYRGVIYGWDTVCSATPAWIREMRVDELPRGRDQPFYSVLVDVRDKPGNWTTYVAEENIELPDEAQPVEHAQVGAHFSRFDEEARRYVPNPELSSRYPEDDDGDEDEDEAVAACTLPPPTITNTTTTRATDDLREEDDGANMALDE